MKNIDIPSLEDQIRALRDLPDDKIDLSDMPERRDWAGAIRGRIYTSSPDSCLTNIDMEIIAWFKRHYSDYGAAINAALREFMASRSLRSPNSK